MFIEVVQAATKAVESENAANGVLGSLGLNWKIFIAQLINFAVVIFVVRQFIYRPLLEAMHKRTKKIEQGIANAQEYEQKLKKWDSQQQLAREKIKTEMKKMYQTAENEALQTKAELFIAAKTEAQKILTRAKEELQEEKEKTLRETKNQAAELVAEAVAKIIKEKITTTKDEALISEKLKKIKV